jgi:hypothetical protein
VPNCLIRISIRGEIGCRGPISNGQLLVSTSRLGEPSAFLYVGLVILLMSVARHLEDDAQVCEPRDSYENIPAFPAGPEEGLEDASDRFALHLCISSVS